MNPGALIQTDNQQTAAASAIMITIERNIRCYDWEELADTIDISNQFGLIVAMTEPLGYAPYIQNKYASGDKREIREHLNYIIFPNTIGWCVGSILNEINV